MSELIRRKDCELILDRMTNEEYLIDIALQNDVPPSEAVGLFGLDILRRIRAMLYRVETVTTDEVLAYKCPECKCVSVLYDPEHEQNCPNCGIKRKNSNE